jgi:hypothetical protein
MKQLTYLTLTVFSFLCLLIATEPHAYAYIDPGSGFVALQTLASVMAACGFFFRTKIARLFGRDKQAEEVEMVPVAAKKRDSRTAA